MQVRKLSVPIGAVVRTVFLALQKPEENVPDKKKAGRDNPARPWRITAVWVLGSDELPTDHPDACKSEPEQSHGGSTVRHTVEITTGGEAKYPVCGR